MCCVWGVKGSLCRASHTVPRCLLKVNQPISCLLHRHCYLFSPFPLPSHLQTFTEISQVYTDRGKVFTTKDGSSYTDLNDPRLGLLLSPDIGVHYNSFTGSIS